MEVVEGEGGRRERGTATSGQRHVVVDGEQRCGNGEVRGIDAGVLLLFDMSVALLGRRPRRAVPGRDGCPHSIITVHEN